MSNQPLSNLESIVNQPISAAPIGDLEFRARSPQVNLFVWLIAIVILAVFLVGCTVSNSSTVPIDAPTAAPTKVSALKGIVTYENLSQNHSDAPQTYAQNPPVGGIHAPAWLNCGIYDQPVPNENAVHSLEHGAVWITYQPELSASTVQRLRTLVKGHAFVILSPYPALPKPVVASAWGVQLPLDDLDEARLQLFISTYEQGPQNPEPGAPCSGGVGEPLKP